MFWLKRVGWGALLWVIMFAWMTILLFGFGFQSEILLWFLSWIGAIIATYYLAKACEVKDLIDGLWVGIIFVAVALLFDYLVTSNFVPELFSSFSIWVGYVITLLVSIFYGYKFKKSKK